MTTNHGNLLIAFIALFNSAVGSVTWSLIVYALHQYRAKNETGDGLSHQIQVLLRNSSQALAFARNTGAMGWQWHNRGPRVLRRITLLGCLGLLVPAMFAVSGIMASRIAITGNVLYHNTFCGRLDFPRGMPALALAEADAEANRAMTLSLAYAQGCYVNPLKSVVLAEQQGFQVVPPATDCDYFVQPRIPWTVSHPGTCPFQDACGVAGSDVIRLDTGLLDSGAYLGHNQPKKNRVLFRRVDTCSPLKSDGFSTDTYEKTPLFDVLGNISWYSYGINYYSPTYLEDFLSKNSTVSRDARNFLFDRNVTFVTPQSALNSAGEAYDIQ